MKRPMVSGFTAVTIAIAMLGCSSARMESSVVAVAGDREAKENKLRLVAAPQFQPLPGQGFRACKLGESCMTMDDRPFEFCLLSSTRCADKIRDPILVEGPEEILPPAYASNIVSHVAVAPGK